jgi:hypothetical protein|tara:strand:- start:124 stop:465 length:342 start_codon:yes stop_codon:yes gene_type:complete
MTPSPYVRAILEVVETGIPSAREQLMRDHQELIRDIAVCQIELDENSAFTQKLQFELRVQSDVLPASQMQIASLLPLPSQAVIQSCDEKPTHNSTAVSSVPAVPIVLPPSCVI